MASPDSLTPVCDESARSRLRGWTDCLLDPFGNSGDQREACLAWCRWGLELLGIDLNAGCLPDSPFSRESLLPSGKAISPLSAARCLWEYRRTAVFLQAMDRALRQAFERFPGERIHIMEAGCGPLAPLTLPFALRYPPERLCITLLDVHRSSLDAARRLAEVLGVKRSLRACLEADATTLRLESEARPHIIACELLLRALKREPQVAATRNLAPQLRPGGIFLPERIDVQACLFDARAYFRHADKEEPLSEIQARSVRDLGLVFSLDAYFPSSLRLRDSGRFAAGSIVVPPHDPHRTPLGFFTKLRVFEDCVLECMDCSLTLFEPAKVSENLPRVGGALDFEYQVSSDPGLFVANEWLDAVEAPLVPQLS